MPESSPSGESDAFRLDAKRVKLSYIRVRGIAWRHPRLKLSMCSASRHRAVGRRPSSAAAEGVVVHLKISILPPSKSCVASERCSRRGQFCQTARGRDRAPPSLQDGDGLGPQRASFEFARFRQGHSVIGMLRPTRGYPSLLSRKPQDLHKAATHELGT